MDYLNEPTEWRAPRCPQVLSSEDRDLCLRSGISEQVLCELRALACRSGLTTLILFGSRARGDHGRASDIDLAALGGSVNLFSLDADELTYTPLRYDVVNLETLKDDMLLSEIRKDGIKIYEQV